jgi:exonuclease III
LAKPKTVKIIQSSKTDNCILSKLQIIGSNDYLNVACMYIQTTDPDRKLAQVMSKFSRWMESKEGENLILVGDFNARIGELDVQAADC